MKLRISLFLLVLPFLVSAENGRISRGEYIAMWKDEAIQQMVIHKIPASITLAQGILESGDGNSELARKSNNHFGIKCHSDWKGKKVYHDDDRRGECFRKYPDARESFNDHSLFLKKRRYESLFELKITDYKGWARGLKKCGYATDPSYARRLIDLIERHDLTQYDKIGLKLIKDGGDLADLTDDRREDRQQQQQQRAEVDDKLPEVDLRRHRAISVSKNRIKYVVGKEGDTFESLAEELEMMPWQIRKYNDYKRGDKPVPGEIVYLQPKRARAKADWHIVKEGETMWQISQHFGIKLKHLYRKNNLEPGTEPPAGTKLSLRKRIR
jgi:LysM repeat protein